MKGFIQGVFKRGILYRIGDKMKTNLFSLTVFILIITGSCFPEGNAEASVDLNPAQERLSTIFSTDFSKNSIDLSILLSGGPGKDGIPALFNPEFESIENTFIDDDIEGALVTVRGVRKFYPYNILVWHEIVNDRIADKDVSVTFCPLCGSAVVYDRNFDEKILDFKVSGLLYESNMVMYDTETESFWLQSIGKGIAGDYNNRKLDRLHFQQLKLSAVKEKYPDTLIMTTNTGYRRNYSFYPYVGYNESLKVFFPVTNFDTSYHPKEMFYIIPLENSSVALRISSLVEDRILKFNEKKLNLTASYSGSEIHIKDSDNNLVPGYYEMWFSWATHHSEDGLIWDP
jgi:hypothetical protein